jgi:hypothetical protein
MSAFGVKADSLAHLSECLLIATRRHSSFPHPTQIQSTVWKSQNISFWQLTKSEVVQKKVRNGKIVCNNT